MHSNFRTLSARAKGNALIAALAFTIALVGYENLIAKRNSPYKRAKRWWKHIVKKQPEPGVRRRRVNPIDHPANWQIVEVPSREPVTKPKRRRRKKHQPVTLTHGLTEPIQIYVQEEPGLSAAELEELKAHRKRAAWERWF